MIFRNAFLSLGGTDLSAYIQSIEPSFDIEMQDDTVMGDTARSNAAGLDVWGFSVTFLNPFAASGPDATIWALKGTQFAIIFRPDAGSATATNPSYTGTGTFNSWKPVGGNVGDEGAGSLELVSGGASIVRAES